MKPRLTLYSRAGCCLCDDMENTIRQVAQKISLELVKIDVDTSAALKARYGAEVPVLVIDGRRAFKFRVTAKELEKRISRRRMWPRCTRGASS